MEPIVISLLVDNVSGVLSRISGLFARRAYNIDSITAGETTNPAITRMTIVLRGDDRVLKQIIAQLQKQVDVRDIKVLEADNSVVRELMLVKIYANDEQRVNLINLADVFRAKILDVETDCLIVELTGSKRKLQAFLDMFEPGQIAELARTGQAGLSRGTKDVKFF